MRHSIISGATFSSYVTRLLSHLLFNILCLMARKWCNMKIFFRLRVLFRCPYPISGPILKPYSMMLIRRASLRSLFSFPRSQSGGLRITITTSSMMIWHKFSSFSSLKQRKKGFYQIRWLQMNRAGKAWIWKCSNLIKREIWTPRRDLEANYADKFILTFNQPI